MTTGFAPGDVLDGKYRLLAPLGSGGMGTVWRAEHLMLRSAVAVKVMHRRIADSADAATRFQREARAAAGLRSPHVVSVLDSGIAGDAPYVVMELLEGESLDQRLRRLGTLGFAEVVRVVTHVARALARAHEAGIVHRDLKPANVFLQHNADEEVAKVLDFGVAKLGSIAELSPLTHTGAVLGSPHYMSPEQARGRREVDHRTDVWALGIIAFECITGRRPFESEILGDLLLRICTDPVPMPSSITPVPPGFDAWFVKATAREAEERFQSVTEMSEALRALAPAPAAVPSLPAPPAHAHAPPRTSSSSGSGILLLLGVGAFGLAALVIASAIGLYAYDVYTSEPSASASAAPPPSAPAIDGTTPVEGVPAASADASAAARPPPTRPAAPKPSATATATASAADTSSAACVQACNKIRACAPGTKCDSSGPCTGVKRALADCANRTPCSKLDQCLP